MTQDTEARALLIKKLLNKAEANGTTPEERESLNEKAVALMLKWGVDDALLDATKIGATAEKIIQMLIRGDAPKSYSYEFALIGIVCAEAMNCRGFYQRQRDQFVAVHVVGHESDVQRTAQLAASLGLQCSMELATAWSNVHTARWNGTEKFNWKRSYVRGFADGLRRKFKAIAVQVAKEPGTDLVLVNRVQQVDAYVANEMRIGTSRPRRYYVDGYDGGEAAGLRANVGQTATGGNRSAVGR